MDKIISELILFILGGFIIVRPKTVVRFQIWIQRTVMGAQYIPSQRTYTALRIIGWFLIILGLVIAVRISR